MNIENQQNTQPTVKRVKYDKAGYYLVIRFFSMFEYKYDHIVITE